MTVAPSGTSLELVDEHRAEMAQALDDVHVVHHFMTDIDRRAEQFEARSTMSIARSTPAQKPRGLASRTFMTSRRARRPSSKESSISSAAPIVMAASATLNAGK